MKNLYQYSGLFAPFTPRFGVLRPFRTQLPIRHQFLSHHPYITQGKRRQDLSRVLGQSFVSHFGWRRCERMDQARVHMEANLSLHAKVPGVNFLRLLHLRIPLAALVPGRARCAHNRGVHNRYMAHQQAPLSEHSIDLGKQAYCKLVTLQQMTEVQNGRLVRQTASVKRQQSKLTHRLNVIQRLFHRRIAKSKPPLHKVNPQHRLQRVGQASLFALGVHRLNQLDQSCPRNNLIHLREKLLASRLLALDIKLYLGIHIGKTQLAHDQFEDSFKPSLITTTTFENPILLVSR